jgi:hypothetical protein
VTRSGRTPSSSRRPASTHIFPSEMSPRKVCPRGVRAQTNRSRGQEMLLDITCRKRRGKFENRTRIQTMLLLELRHRRCQIQRRPPRTPRNTGGDRNRPALDSQAQTFVDNVSRRRPRRELKVHPNGYFTAVHLDMDVVHKSRSKIYFQFVAASKTPSQASVYSRAPGTPTLPC